MIGEIRCSTVDINSNKFASLHSLKRWERLTGVEDRLRHFIDLIAYRLKLESYVPPNMIAPVTHRENCIRNQEKWRCFVKPLNLAHTSNTSRSKSGQGI